MEFVSTINDIPLILRDDINILDHCLVTDISSQNENCLPFPESKSG